MRIFLTTTALFSRYKILIGSILFLALYSSALIAFATPPASPFTAGETNDPSCGPTDTNCYVGDAITVDSTYYNIYSGTTGAGAELNGAGGGTDNIFLGSNAGAVTDTGTGNLFFGSESGALNTSGDSNIFMGLYAGATNDVGAFNTFIGYKAGTSNTSGIRNIGIGASGNSPNAGSLSALTTGNANTALGNQSGITLETGDGNVLFGYNANVLAADDSYATAIGFSATAAASGIALGHAAIAASYEFALDPDITNWEFQGDSYVLPVNGSISTAGVLTNDGAGNLTWEAGGGGLIGSTSSSGTETWLGDQAGANSGFDDHTIFVGINAGEGATGAVEGTFIGYNAGSDATDAIYSIFMGSNSGDNAANASESVFLGYNSGLNATNALRSTFVGTDTGDSASDAEYSVFIGNGSGYHADNAAHSTFIGYAGSGAANAAHSIFIGDSAGTNDTVNNTSSGHSILIGDSTSTGGFKNSIAIGTAATNSAINQLVIGGSGYSITDGYIGNGVTNLTPAGFTLNATGGVGTNITGGSLTLAGGKGTGSALGGSIIFKTSDAGSSGTTLESLTEKVRITPYGKLGIGTSTPIGMLGINMPDNLLTTTQTTFIDGGSAQNDATFSGTYSGTGPPNTIIVYIDSEGTPDTFGWYDNNSDCAGDSGVAITGSAQSLCDGISVTFGATTGHLSSDEWDYAISTVTGVANAISTTDIGGTQGAFFVNVGPEYSNFIGSGAGTGATAGAYAAVRSNFIGLRTGYEATSAEYSNFMGYQAGYYAANATYSNFIGSDAGNGAINATHSTFIGDHAGYSADNAANSIFIGYHAGYNSTIDTTSSGTSILIGDSTSNGNYIDSIALGKSATNTATNQFMIGSTASPIDSTRINGSASTQCTITTGTGIACTSDERLKTNITDLNTNVLENLLKVKTVTYNWLAQPDGAPMIGFLAQDLEQYYPELVATDSTGYKSVYYSQMTPILVEAIRELDVKIDALPQSSSGGGGFSFDSILASFENAIVKVKKLIVGSSENPSGIILYDTETHTPYCVTITNGELLKTAGECDTTTESTTTTGGSNGDGITISGEESTTAGTTTGEGSVTGGDTTGSEEIGTTTGEEATTTSGDTGVEIPPEVPSDTPIPDAGN